MGAKKKLENGIRIGGGGCFSVTGISVLVLSLQKP